MTIGIDYRELANPGFKAPTPEDDQEQEENKTPNPEEAPAEIEKEIDPKVEEQEEPKEKEKPEEAKPPVKPEIDYKEKFANSTREAQILAAKNKQLSEALEMITTEEIPSDEELAEKDPDWEYRSDFEKDMARRMAATERNAAKARLLQEQLRAEQVRIEELGRASAANPELIGREKEFEAFCAVPSRKAIPIADLVGAFLWDIRDEIDGGPGRKADRRPVLEGRSAGERIEPKKKDEVADMINLMKTDPQKYNEIMLKKSRMGRK